MTAKDRPGNGRVGVEGQGGAGLRELNVGQHVRHVRRPDFGVGEIAELYTNSFCKAIFPGRVFTGVPTSVFEPVCLEAIRKEEQEAARQKEEEREAALKRKRQQLEEAKQRLLETRRFMLPGYAFPRTEGYFDKELQRIEMLTEAISNSRDQEESGTVEADGENWWYQSIRKGEKKNDFPPIETKVVGVSYEGRQGVIAQMEENEQVLLVREPDNPHDENAVSVQRANGRQVGYLPRDLASRVAPMMDASGKPLAAVVTDILGHDFIDGMLGVRIRFSQQVEKEEQPENATAMGGDDAPPPF